MKIADYKVGTRMLVGFATLLLATAIMGGLGVYYLGKVNETVRQMATDDFTTLKDAISIRSNIRSVAARTSEYLLSDDAARDTCQALVKVEGDEFEHSSAETTHRYETAREVIFGILALALALGITT